MEFETFPLLETERLRLRALEERDAQALFRLFGDEAVTEFYDLQTFTDVTQAVQMIDRFAQRYRDEQAIRWGITQRGEDTVIGTVGLYVQPHARGGLGYDLAPPYWRQGIMTEALRTVIRFAFADMEVNRLEALVMPGNVASLKLLRKLGFTDEGVLRDYLFFKGAFQDLHMFSLLRKEHNV